VRSSEGVEVDEGPLCASIPDGRQLHGSQVFQGGESTPLWVAKP
jgi:hypothetical protein